MAARSAGIFPREGFNLDEECRLTTTPTPVNATLTSMRTVRILVLGATGLDNGVNKVTVTIGDFDLRFGLSEVEDNGSVILHFRGALMDESTLGYYTLAGTAQVDGVFYEILDRPRQ